jgi:hypothetical protein
VCGKISNGFYKRGNAELYNGLHTLKINSFDDVHAEMWKIVSKTTDDIRILTDVFNEITNMSKFTSD